MDLSNPAGTDKLGWFLPMLPQKQEQDMIPSCNKSSLGCRRQAVAGREAIVPKQEPQGSEEKGVVQLQQAVAT